jgi:hypothetical protein
MQHIPHPNDAHSPISIPYLRGLEYDGQGFLGYPNRQGWNLPKLRASFGDELLPQYLESATLRETQALFRILKSQLSEDDLTRHAEVVQLGDMVFERIVSRMPDTFCVNVIRGEARHV